MGKPIDVSGQTFHRLTVIEIDSRNKYGHVMWRCKCICGKIVIASGILIRRGGVKSCGCWRREGKSKGNWKHGTAKEKWYSVWHGMMDRCYNPNHPAYKNYGKRGIKVCFRWHDPRTFFKDMGYKPEPGLSIERVDNNLGYSPENCRWSTFMEQGKNRRNNHLIAYNSEVRHLSEWARIYHLSNSTLSYRIKSNWTIKRALNEPIRNNGHKQYLHGS
jgi:hypothetical protein